MEKTTFKKVREAKGLTKAEVMKATGLSKYIIDKAENDIGNLYIDKFCILCKYYKINPDTIKLH